VHLTSDLFEISKPGNYALRIRFQILAFPATEPASPGRARTNILIRFPPLDYPLIDPERPVNKSKN
jgi:hypothetical protein